MNKHYLLGTLAVAIGIVMLFVIKIFETYMYLTLEASHQPGLIYYPMAFFVMAALFYIAGWWKQDLKKQQETAVQPVKSS
ncbi:hypothetical protein [Exiguobacterium artemiae]|uniref:hypothetical protein n=1 Tax=Exiguobacterium artemiae TaxID=340145 RepID=UPI00047B1508|nr:hypothetical protein [Exiguobacterium sibiricum]